MSYRTFLAVIALGLGLQVAPVTAASLNDKLIQDAKDCSPANVQQDLANGADVNATHPNGRTALMLAAEWCVDRDENIASMLLDHGANVNARDNIGRTALMFAASVDNDDIARVLLARAADVNAKANDGSTALDFADTDPMGADEVVSLLQAAGAQ